MTAARELPGRLRRRFPTIGHFALFVRIYLCHLLLRPGLRLLSLPVFLRLLTPGREPAAPTPEAWSRAEVIDLYVAIILRLNTDNAGRNCLPRSLLLFRFLRRAGLPARFCVGVRRQDQELQGHAWVEIEGRHFKDSQAHVPYCVTFAHPPAGR